MKKTWIVLSLCVAIAACGRSGSNNEANRRDSAEASKQVAGARNQAADTNASNIGTEPGAAASSSTTSQTKGKDLIAKADCLACHKENEKLVGPSYVDVANKYEDNKKNVDYLAEKIIKGGQGVWGQVPMTPHPALSKDDAEEMARYILSLRKK